MATVAAERLLDSPIIDTLTHPSIGRNIQGPSLIRAPDWVGEPLGRYYLYFADHKGDFIRLAYADRVEGPWSVHPPGSLRLADSCFLTAAPPAGKEELDAIRDLYDELFGAGQLSHDLTLEATTPHIASPDVHVDRERQRVIMYFHGLDGLGVQVSRAAVSSDGITFRPRPETLGPPYLRAFRHDDSVYALTMPGQFLRSADGLSDFEPGPTLFGHDMRHAAVCRRGTTLHVFWSRVGDAPERILHSTVLLTADWSEWSASEPTEVLRPERPWEGARAPVEPSVRSTAYGHVNQLRDPAVFEEDGRTFLLYSVAGESGIGLAELDL